MNDKSTRGTEGLIHTCLLAGAIDDSLGADIEFWDIEDISEEFPEGIHQLSTEASNGGRMVHRRYSDDAMDGKGPTLV